jgi:hypothetical protein
VVQAFDDFRYHRTFDDDRNRARFSARSATRTKGIDMIRFDEAGASIEYGRPATA